MLRHSSQPSLCNTMDYSPPGSSVHGNSPGKNTGVGCHALLQGIFPTQGSNPGLPHWGQILDHLSHQGSPRILEWVAYPFSRGTSRPRNPTGVFRITGGFFNSWANREVQFSSVQSLSYAWLFATSWTTACQDCLSRARVVQIKRQESQPRYTAPNKTAH